jgi:tRNA(fMet)-specific endonuclease VapC
LAVILADTDVLIDYLNGKQPIFDQVSEYIRSDNLQTSSVNCFELLSGARSGKRADRVHRLVDTIAVLPLDLDSARKAAEVRQRLEESGGSIGMADSLVAGIALANDLPLMTRNRKHFEAVEGLRLISVAGI